MPTRFLFTLATIGFTFLAAAQSEDRTLVLQTKYLHFYSDWTSTIIIFSMAWLKAGVM